MLFAKLLGKLHHPMDHKTQAAAPILDVRILKGGPAVIKGGFTLIGPDGKPLVLNDEQKEAGVAFCRCGHSAGHPFCDGAHAKP